MTMKQTFFMTIDEQSDVIDAPANLRGMIASLKLRDQKLANEFNEKVWAILWMPDHTTLAWHVTPSEQLNKAVSTFLRRSQKKPVNHSIVKMEAL